MMEEAGTFAEQGGQVVVELKAATGGALPKVAQELVGLRKEAIEGREQSGIEARWHYAENAYNSVDEATSGGGSVLKPSAPDAPFIVAPKKGGWQRSTAFMNITRPYVDASAARVSDMLFTEDERNWEIRPTPKLDVEEMEELIDQLAPEEAAQAMEWMTAQMEEAVDSVGEAQQQIDDWLTESDWNGVGRQIVWDAARIGTGIVKGPVPMMLNGKIQPGVKLVKAQNCYPDPSCGQDVHDGEYFFERELIVPRKFRQMRKMASAGWLPFAIDECLGEGPKYFSSFWQKEKKQYELWHFQGEVPVELLLECGCKVDDSSKKVWANVTLCNNAIVRVSLMPLQKRFSYNVLPWQERNGHWAGIGVAEQIETPQRGLNAAVRNMFDNSALTALPQIVHWRGVLKPLNGRYELAPGKQWEVAGDDVDVRNVQNAIMTIEIPSRQGELMQIIDLMRNIAQEVTGLPLIMMGQGSSGAVGSDQIQTNAATTVLRRLAKLFDEKVTRPLITSFYRWIGEYDVLDVPEAAIEPRGSSVLIERDIQAQALIQMVQISKDPVYGMDPELVAAEWMRSQKFDPKKVKLSDERKQQLMEAMNAPDKKAQAQVESAKLRAEALTKQAEMEAESDRVDTMAKAQSEERDRQHDQVMLDLKYKYELIKYAMERKIDVGTAMEELESVKGPKLEGAPLSPAPSSGATPQPSNAIVPSAAEGVGATPPLKAAPEAVGGPQQEEEGEEVPESLTVPSLVVEE